MAGLSWRAAVAGCILISILLTGLYLNSRAVRWIFSLVDFFETRSPTACVVYVLVYIVVNIFCLPLTPLEIFTGFCFRVPLGILLDMVGRVSGAVICFLCARALLHFGLSEQLLEGSKAAAVLRGIGAAVEERGLRILVLFNLAYVPVAIKNYGLGFVPEVPLSLFVAAIFIIEIPMASIWACIGSAAADDFAAAGLSGENGTSIDSAISGQGANAHPLWLKVGLLVVGIGSILLVLHAIHKSVDEELRKVNVGEYEAAPQPPDPSNSHVQLSSSPPDA